MHEEKQWKMVIDPSDVHIGQMLRELWQYRDLVGLFVKRDFIAKYKQTILGPIWAILKPVLMTVVFTVVFGNFARLTTMDAPRSGQVIVPAFLFYMLGNVLWSYFSSTVKEVGNAFLKNARTMEKVYYPRLVSPVASALFGVLTLAVQLALFAVLLLVMIGRGTAVVRPTAALLLFPAVVAELVLFSLGTGLVVLSFTAKYRDVIMLVDFGLQLWLYATPVAYGLQLVPEKWLGLYMLNPLTSILTTARTLCFGEGYFRPGTYAQGWAISLAVFLLGIVLFHRTEKNFVDTI